ncbi:putative rhamnosyl transferase [Defluviimonas salinarum]|uniref:Rhamnosyl transferase n=1 Tax=Defluviimonas salinarum TaxID=2992147 RepID=A0ABT3JAK7_9RHOB|nr:putative rhamnosyl transferase [Defluviimonas salinarum]
MKIQVLGVCRFSLLVQGGFQRMPEDLEARRRVLYDPARLESRVLWFEHVFLPSIRAQTDPDFTLTVVTGSDFPDPWRGRLQDLIAGIPQIELVFVPPHVHRDACRPVLCTRTDPKADVVAQFRLDDDDAVAVDFVRRIRRDFRTFARPLYEAQGLVSIDYCRGFALTGFGARAALHFVSAPLWTPALTVCVPPSHEKSVLDYPHHLLFRHMPGISLNDRLMFVRGFHDSNDSSFPARNLSAPIAPDEAADWTARRFGIDFDRFSAALAAAPVAG